jgi:thiosulfate/3-mercaptopyruvate sulfurtransferase
MKTESIILSTILALLASAACLHAKEPWTDKELKDPAALAATLADAKAVKPVILNIGPVQQIKGAIAIGPAVDEGNLDKLKKELAKTPRDKEVIIYCGCCPFQRCPNIRPAFERLKKMKFTDVKVLNLPSGLNQDWIHKGYPLE